MSRRAASAFFATLTAIFGSALPRDGFGACPNFEKAAIYSTGSLANSVAVGDFNGDGYMDLALANIFSDDVSILLGNSNGTFAVAASYVVEHYPEAIATGDFNGDGRQDLVVANYLSDSVSVLRGKGDGTFAAPINSGVGLSRSPSSVAVADFNNDGKLDAVVLGSNVASILLGTGDGSLQCFKCGAQDSAVGYGTAIVVDDFNDDGKADLAMGVPERQPPVPVDPNSGISNVTVHLGNGDGTFDRAEKVRLVPDIYPTSLAVGDFNRDGKRDLAVADGRAFSVGSVSILTGNGDGTFAAPAKYSTGIDSRSVASGDFDRDGIPDLAVANHGSNTVSILYGIGNGVFAASVNYLAGSGPSSVAVADLNRDGREDLAVGNNLRINSFSQSVAILLSTENRSFAATRNLPIGGPTNAIAADLNQDGKIDLAITNSANAVSILVGDGNGVFSAPVNYPTGAGPLSVAIGDFNGDGKKDLVTANYSAHNVSILLGNGAATFSPPINFEGGDNPSFVVVGDFNNDGKSDLVVTDDSAFVGQDRVSILLGNGNGTFTFPMQYRAGDSPRSAAIGDFNQDGNVDLAVGNFYSGSVSILLGNGDGTFAAAVDAPVGTFPSALATGDFNGDGKTDLAVADYSDALMWILIGNGNGTFARPVGYASPLGVGTSQSSAVAIGDVNGDGKTDIAIANSLNNSVVVLLGKGDGTFISPTAYAIGTEPISLAVGDFDSDGRSDLAIVSYMSNEVSVLLSACSVGPICSWISPTSGPAAGGQSLTINGTGLSGATAVTFGGIVATIIGNTSTTITVRTPPHSAGQVDVVVTTTGGSATALSAYTYIAAPVDPLAIPVLSARVLLLLAAVLSLLGSMTLRK